MRRVLNQLFSCIVFNEILKLVKISEFHFYHLSKKRNNSSSFSNGQSYNFSWDFSCETILSNIEELGNELGIFMYIS